MSFKLISWAAVTAALALCCACGAVDKSVAEPSDISSALSSKEAASQPLYHGETALHWQTPACGYRMIKTVAGEAGFAVLYEEQRPRHNEDTEQYRFLMAQVFNAQGDHELTAYTGIYDELKKGDVTPNGARLTHDKLYLDMGGDSYRGVDRATGVSSQWHYGELVRQDGAALSYSSEYSDQVGSIGMRYRLKTADGTVLEMTVPEFDDNFTMALDFLHTGEPHDDRPGVTFTAKVSLDAAAKTATLTNTKLTYELNFDTLAYTRTRRYTDEMLKDILATSPSGDAVLYSADSGGAGDMGWRDVVLKGGDGSVTFVDYCTELYNAAFFDDGTVVLNKVLSLEAYDIGGAEPVARSILGLGITDVEGYTCPERLVIGMAVDRQNQLLLAAVRDYTQEWDALLPVTLTVFDADLNQLATLETDCRIPPFRHNWPVRCDISLNSDGTANLSWMEETPIQVRYLP